MVGPLAGRDDAALLPQVPRRRGQGRRPRRPRALKPRHDNPGAIVAGATFCPACDQQPAGSPFLTHLNAGDETPGAVSYTQIETRYDEVVTPYTSAFLAPGPRTANILLQDACPAEVIDHHEMPNDGLAIRWALQALGRPGPADPAHPPSCACSGMDEPRGLVGPRGSTCPRPTPEARLASGLRRRARGRCAAASAGPWAGTSSSRPGASSWPAAARRGPASRRAGSPPTGRCPSS